MRVLIGNDDGIDAPGIALLARAARTLAADVWIVAPERKWTAASHQLTFDRDLTLTRVAERAYACSGAPADCVVAAMTLLFADGPRPDLALAGVNDQPNVAEDIAYSGTMAVAREATFWGVPAVSLARARDAIPRDGDADVLGRLLATLWRGRADWALAGHWLGVNLPASLPAPLAQPRTGRDKIAGACDVLDASDERIRYRLRRGRPGTIGAGDENACLAAGSIGVQRFCWRSEVPLPRAVVAGWRAATEC
jgi:5'-nucleotidase